MASYDLGDVAALAVEVRDSAGTLADATTVVLTVTLPDATTATPVVAHPSTGRYTASYTPAAAGRYAVRWVATGTNASAYTDAFTVLDPAELGLVGLADVKSHLNMTGTTSDEELRATLLAATVAAEDHLGRPLRRAARTQTFYTPVGNGRGLVLKHTDIASVTEVTADGTVLAATDYDADLSAGVLWAGSWAYPVAVEYTTAAVESPALRQAVLELTRHLWETQRGSMPMLPRGIDGMDAFNPATGYSLPRRVVELLAPYRMPA